jgi:hypothetical protein
MCDIISCQNPCSVNPNVNYELEHKIMYKYSFLSCDNCTPTTWNVKCRGTCWLGDEDEELHAPRPPPHTPCSNPAAPAAESWKWSFQNFSLSGQSQVVILLVTNTYLCHLWCLYTCDSNCLCSPSHPLPPEKADFTLPRFCLEPVSAMMASSLVSADTNMADDNYLAGGYSALPKWLESDWKGASELQFPTTGFDTPLLALLWPLSTSKD